MDFQGKGRPISRAGMQQICKSLSVKEPEVWALLTVETRGFGFIKDRRPQILFERHIFSRLTEGQYDAGHPDISHKTPGGYAGGPNEYHRLQKAVELDRNAALKSTSWGIGQVMGFNYNAAGFGSIDEMVTRVVQDEDAQLLALANFITANNLAYTLQSCNWSSFARGYNGQDFQKNSYDARLAAAHSQFKVMLPDISLRAAQVALLYLGFNPGTIDGVYGRYTRAALAQFQEKHGLPPGELDPATETKLFAEAFAV
jgi:hypothetical protein